MTDNPVRDTGELLADMDTLLAEVDDARDTPVAEADDARDTPAPVEAPPEAPAAPETDAVADEYAKVTAGRDPSAPRQRTRQIQRNARYGYGTDAITADEPVEATSAEDDETPVDEPDEAPDESADNEPDPAPAPPATTKSANAKKPKTAPKTATDADDDEEDEDETAEEPKRRQVVITTVREWRPPAGPRGKAWGRALAYTGSGIIIGWLTGTTRAVYVTLDELSVNVDAVAGILISAPLAALLISRSVRVWIALGVALLLVLVIKLLSLALFVGGVVSLITWGLDQRARHMRPLVAWTARAAFATVTLATLATSWTTIVHVLTGAAQ